MEEQKDTVVEAPVAPGVSAPGHAEAAPSPIQADVTAEQAAPSPVKEETATEYQPRYLGKKYSDVAELEKAHENALRLANEQGQVKNALEQKVELMEAALKQYGISPEQPQTPQPTSPVDTEALIEQKLAPVRRQMALREEADAVAEVVRLNPELSPVASRIIQAWRLSGNESLESVVKDFKKLVNVGRNISKEDAATKVEQAVETGKGMGEAKVAPRNEARQAAYRSHSLEDLAATLPDDLGIK